MKQQVGMLFFPFALDASSSIPLYHQLYDALRQAILTKQLEGGTQLPSTRSLAQRLHISRTTVVLAFEMLLSEGYVESRAGSGTYVATTLPDELLHKTAPPRIQLLHEPDRRRRLSQRGAILAATDVATVHYYSEARAFRPGIPDIDAFPFGLWSRLAAQHWRNPPRQLMGYSHPAGYYPLRTAIATYLGMARGVQCMPEQVIVVSGSQQAIDLAARVLLDTGDDVWMEDPGYPGAQSALLGVGANLVPVAVDAEGLDVSTAITQCPHARMVYVTPSYQFPLGATMSLARRLRLLQWASSTGAWILEDDYDSEFRYSGHPLSALQGIDTTGQVLYIGTFSKVLFPALRLGYLVVPPDLIDAFTAARAVADRHSPLLDQVILADFITQGHFVRHIRHMRAIYAERQSYLVDIAQRELRGLLDVQTAEAGMHLVGTLVEGIDDLFASQQAVRHGLIAPALSAFYKTPSPRQGLLLGYTAIDEYTMNEGIQRLADVLTNCYVDARRDQKQV